MQDLDDIAPAGETAHVFERVKVLANGCIVWQCPHCAARIMTPPAVIHRRSIVLRRGDLVTHSRLVLDEWPGWPVARGRTPAWYEEN